MYVPEELRKVNEFVDARIPSNRDYFSRFGSVSGNSGAYTGDDVAPLPMDKVDTLAAGESATMNDVRAAAAAAVEKQRKIDEDAREAAASRAARAAASSTPKTE